METQDKSSFINGKIYCIRSFKTDNIYIGSTTQKLNRRLKQHISQFKGGSGNYSSSQIIKYGDAYITVIENCNNFTKAELIKREREHIRLNKNICVNCFMNV
jgi:predicted GIY-YIG superfamily endonuclease